MNIYNTRLTTLSLKALAISSGMLSKKSKEDFPVLALLAIYELHCFQFFSHD